MRYQWLVYLPDAAGVLIRKRGTNSMHCTARCCIKAPSPLTCSPVHVQQQLR
jgi:hypothetical protein